MDKYEELTKMYLRLNGYFLVENFIVHNGGADISDSYERIIPQLTEVDILGVRFPHQKEIAGNLNINNHKGLIIKTDAIDFVIVESKKGQANKPNPTWRSNAKIDNVEYLVRFLGISNNKDEINKISNELVANYKVSIGQYSIRYILVSEKVNDAYSFKGVRYITVDEILNFIVQVRGNCWIDNNLGIASHHQQWNEFMKVVFNIANDHNKSVGQRKIDIRAYLQT